MANGDIVVGPNNEDTESSATGKRISPENEHVRVLEIALPPGAGRHGTDPGTATR